MVERTGEMEHCLKCPLIDAAMHQMRRSARITIICKVLFIVSIPVLSSLRPQRTNGLRTMGECERTRAASQKWFSHQIFQIGAGNHTPGHLQADGPSSKPGDVLAHSRSRCWLTRKGNHLGCRVPHLPKRWRPSIVQSGVFSLGPHHHLKASDAWSNRRRVFVHDIVSP